MWVAIVFLVPLVVVGVITLLSFFTGQITVKEVFSEVGKLNPIPKVSDLNPALLILGAGGILVGIAAVIAANKGQPYTAPAPTSFAVQVPGGGVSVNQPYQAPPAAVPPAGRGRRP